MNMYLQTKNQTIMNKITTYFQPEFYHDEDIEEVTILDADGIVTYSLGDDEVSSYSDILESFVGWRGTKKQLEAELSEIFNKKIELHDTTEKDETDYDYMYTFNIVGDNDDKGYWIDADIYFLKMRKRGNIYVTEVNVEMC